MTHIVIHTDKKVREKYLLKLISYILKRELTKVSELKNIPDIHILECEKESIGIETVKELQKEMIFKPFEEKYQIAVINDAHTLTEEAQNAILKTLEDALGETVYILLLDNERNVLSTILSRGIKHFVKEKGEETHLDIEKPSILKGDLIERFKEIENISSKDTKEVIVYLSNLQNYYRGELKERLVDSKDTSIILKKMQSIDVAVERIRGNGNKRLVLENLILQIS